MIEDFDIPPDLPEIYLHEICCKHGEAHYCYECWTELNSHAISPNTPGALRRRLGTVARDEILTTVWGDVLDSIAKSEEIDTKLFYTR